MRIRRIRYKSLKRGDSNSPGTWRWQTTHAAKTMIFAKKFLSAAPRIGYVRTLCAISIFFAAGTPVFAQTTYPSKPIRVVTPGTGGSSDISARLIAQALSVSLGQSVIVDNRPSGVIPGEIVAKAPADGHTLLYTGNSHWLAEFLHEKVPYDPIRDFLNISLAVSSPNIIVVNPALPVGGVKDLIALAKAKPGTLNYGSSGTGAANHLAPELFKAMAGINIVRVNYKGAGAAINDVISGEIQMMITPAAGVMTQVRSGRLKALAVTSASPSELFPGLPTASVTLDGFHPESIYGVFAPAKTPAAIIRRLNAEIVQAIRRADVKEKLGAMGMEGIGSTPEQLGATIKSEIARIGKLIKDIGIREN